MKRSNRDRTLAAVLGGLVAACGGGGATTSPNAETGDVQIALVQVPADVACLKLTVTGARASTQLLDVTPGAAATYTLSRLPLGIITIAGEAYGQFCSAIGGAVASYVTEAPVSVRVDAVDVNKANLLLIRNGRVSVGLDFEPTPPTYLVPVAPGVVTKALLTVGESVNKKPDGTPYRMVGIPDGLGAFDNNDGSFTLLMNHELGTGGFVRAHGAATAFVSTWRIRKTDLTTLAVSDLIQDVAKFDPVTASYQAPAKGNVFQRFCSADLPALSAFYDAASGLGYNGRLFMNGEETGNGRAFAHAMTGTSYELPRLGKQAWENIIANPGTGSKTVVAGTDDTTPGQVFIYVGTKTGAGSPVEKAGLTNGQLYGVAVAGVANEPSATGIASGTAFTLASLGNVETWSEAQLEAAATTAGVTRFLRPEDGAWDPTNPADFYFVTTNAFTAPSRLWRLHFTDINNPAAGGTIDMLMDGTEGQKMFDNLTVDKKGHVYLTEDVGNNAHIGKIWRYTIATDTAVIIAQHNLDLFTPGAPKFLTQDEEASGIIDASDVIGPGWLLVDVQAHYATEPELVEGGQLLAIYDPAGL
jgi:hypothetical protein